ncbi:MAG: hypothetical protein ABIQ90_10205, partial [Polaromonas sp.]
MHHLLPETPATDSTEPDRQLQALLERATSAGSWTLALPDGRLSWTAPLAELLQMPLDATSVYKDPLDFYAPESREQMSAALIACLTHAVPFDEEVEVLTARGRRL